MWFSIAVFVSMYPCLIYLNIHTVIQLKFVCPERVPTTAVVDPVPAVVLEAATAAAAAVSVVGATAAAVSEGAVAAAAADSAARAAAETEPTATTTKLLVISQSC